MPSPLPMILLRLPPPGDTCPQTFFLGARESETAVSTPLARAYGTVFLLRLNFLPVFERRIFAPPSSFFQMSDLRGSPFSPSVFVVSSVSVWMLGASPLPVLRRSPFFPLPSRSSAAALIPKIPLTSVSQGRRQSPSLTLFLSACTLLASGPLPRVTCWSWSLFFFFCVVATELLPGTELSNSFFCVFLQSLRCADFVHVNRSRFRRSRCKSSPLLPLLLSFVLFSSAANFFAPFAPFLEAPVFPPPHPCLSGEAFASFAPARPRF